MLKKLFGGFRKKKATTSGTSDGPNFTQRRKSARRACQIPVELQQGRTEYQAEVVDLSAGGLKLKCDAPFDLKLKKVLKVTYPEALGKQDIIQIDTVPHWFRIRQYDGALFIGVEYKDPKQLGRSWVKAVMQDIGFRPYNIKEQRKEFRLSCKIPGIVDVAGQQLDCKVLNMGLGGMYIELTKPLRAGAAVKVKLDDNPFIAKGVYEGAVRHQQHPDPSSPFGHGLSFTSLSDEQTENLREFLKERQQTVWEEREMLYDPSADYYAAASQDSEEEGDDVEVPDLDAILEETKDVEFYGEEEEEDDAEGEDEDSEEEEETT